jgi:hypothetical protein
LNNDASSAGLVGLVASALIGDGVGAPSGAAAPPKHLDLGPPPWSDPHSK